MPAEFETAAILLGGVLWVGIELYSRFRDAVEPTEKERLDEQYRTGEISHTEYERRLELVLDDENDHIRSLVEQVNGVGPKMSRDIALAFGSVEELRRADVEELTAIHGVGESTAEAIRDEVG